jgi:sulfite reductase subunit B
MAETKTQQVEQVPEKSLYLPEIAEVTRVKSLTKLEKLFEIRLPDGRDLGHEPGQFVEVSIFGIGEAPISVSSSPTRKGSFELCVRAVGNVTNALHRLNQGDAIGIRGPFGKGFDVEELKGRDMLFIGGGIGLVPLRSLINYVLDKRKDFAKVTILYGTKQPSEILFRDELNKWDEDDTVDFRITVDKGDESWTGHTGVITTLIPDIAVDVAKTTAVVVGPPIMYRFVIKALKEKKLPEDRIVVSLERRMKCGVGKCGHCQMGHLYVCQDGPVFKYSQIRDIREAL